MAGHICTSFCGSARKLRARTETAWKFREVNMCPACIATAAVMAAGAGSTGGILAVYIGKFRKFFSASGPGLFQKIKEK